MNGTEHPETEQLVAYAEQPESVEHRPVGLHLAVCTQCRRELETRYSLRQHAGWIATETGESSDQIVDFFHDRLSGQVAAELRDSINQNPAMLREALHYARHHVAMQRNVETPEVPMAKHSVWNDIKRTIIESLKFETPVWKLIPLAVVLVAVVSVFSGLEYQSQGLQVARVIKFDDQPGIQFVSQESQPGIGFFSNAKETSIPFEGVSVQMERAGEIAFTWPVIDGAKNYRFKLQVFRNGETVVLGRYLGSKPEAVIKLVDPPGQHRYEWVLAGDTINKQSFQTTGGFVVVR